MEPLVWQEEWSVGNESLDRDHKRLVEIINSISETSESSEDAIRLLDDLRDYTEMHFGKEERMMEAAQIPGFVEHAKHHRLFIAWLDSMQTVIRSPKTHAIIFDAVNNFLRNWLEAHILTSDMQYKGKL